MVLFTDTTPFAVETLTGLRPFTPTNTQFAPVLQLSALIPVNDEPIEVSAVHCVPPSLVANTGVGAPLKADPTASQTVLEHDNWLNVALPGGITTEVHVVPPSVVTTSKAAALALCSTAGLAPIATQVVAD
jgi:hypothetical protein